MTLVAKDYIALLSCSHSGSTLLSLLLCFHPEAVGGIHLSPAGSGLFLYPVLLWRTGSLLSIPQECVRRDGKAGIRTLPMATSTPHPFNPILHGLGVDNNAVLAVT